MNKKIQLVADENMLCVEQLFATVATIKKHTGRNIKSCDLTNADALLCRSVTQVNQTLLSGSPVSFVGSATIGIDHLDISWLDKQHIKWSSAAGCNAAAVAQYVLSGICYWLKKSQIKSSLSQLTIGIVGAGNVGTELAHYLDILGGNYYLCDPPLQRQGDKRDLVGMDKIMSCDVISLHVPINYEGKDKTFHLFDKMRLNQMSSQQLLINAARGNVIDNDALVSYLQQDDSASVILDVFENEPKINPKLARLCLLATPHIAGHTLEGKLRGSYMVYQAFCEEFNLSVEQEFTSLLPQTNTYQHEFQSSFNLEATLLSLYDISNDSAKFLKADDNALAINFDSFRKGYIESFNDTPRRDYNGWKLEIINQNESISQNSYSANDLEKLKLLFNQSV